MALPKIIQEVLNRVSFAGAQTLTSAQKAQARTNIGAADDAGVVHLAGPETITGAKIFGSIITTTASGLVFRRGATTGNTVISGGNGYETGANVDLSGSTRSGFEGTFRINAIIDTNTKSVLIGKPDGTLTWNGKDILTAINGVTLDTTQTVTGQKTFNGSIVAAGGVLQRGAATALLDIRGGTTNSNAAYIRLYGGNRSANAGELHLGAHDGTNGKEIVAKPDGTLQWDGNDVLTSANGVTLDTDQTITGVKTFSQRIYTTQQNTLGTTTDDSYVRIMGGSANARSANLKMSGMSESGSPGAFILQARSSSEYKNLIGLPDGSLQWNNSDILTAANGVTLDTAQTISGSKTFSSKIIFSTGHAISRNTTTAWIAVRGGTDDTDGASLVLSGSTRSGHNGDFSISAKDATNKKVFSGTADGTLTWDSKEIERVSETGTGYIKYESGLMLCWGGARIIAGDTSVQVTYPQPFANSYSLATTMNSMIAHGSFSQSETGFTEQIASASANDITVRYVAVGTWN